MLASTGSSESLTESTSSSLMTSATIYISLATLAALAYYLYTKATEQNWPEYGVKQPKLSPLFLLGGDIKVKLSNLIHENGDTVGIKDGSRLGLITVNFNLLRHILIKDFNNFSDRRDRLRSPSPFGKSLFFATGTSWRRQRQILSPTFSTGKLKNISKLVDQSARNLTKYFAQCAQSGTLVPMKDLTSRYTCEIIAKTAFGLDANFIEEKDAEFLDYARNILRPLFGIRRLMFRLLDKVPNLIYIVLNFIPFMQWLNPINVKSDNYFRSTLASTFAERRLQRQEGVTRSYKDFLDLMLKANEDAEAGKLEKGDIGDEQICEGGPLKAFTDEEMLGSSILFIFAGMETTATTLHMCFYELAVNQDIQEKVYQEILEVVKDETPTSEELNQLHYTEQTINETLRMYPPAPIMNRKAKETRNYEGITIPKDAFIVLPYYHILQDPKIYPNPDKFDPDRFCPEEKNKRDPLAFVAFGQGPRLCLGMRLAYLELKVALVHVLRKVKVILTEETEPKKSSPGVQFKNSALVTPVNPIMLAFELRE